MKTQLFFIFLYSLQILYCQDSKGGIIVQITEQMAYESLDSYLNKFNSQNRSLSFGFTFQKKSTITSFTLSAISKNMISIKFLSDRINIIVRDLKGEFNIRQKVFLGISRKKTTQINNINVEVDVRIKSERINNRLVLSGEFIRNPIINIRNQYLKNLNMNTNDENQIIQKFKEVITSKCKDILNSFLSLFPKNEVDLNPQQGLYADYSLVTPVVMNDGYFVINSYRRIYKKSISKTLDKEKYISYLPSNLNSPGKQFRLYISKSNIVSSFESMLSNTTEFFRISSYIDQTKFDPLLLKKLLKFNYQEFDGKSKLKIKFDLYRHLKVEIDTSYLYVKFDALILIYHDYQNEREPPAYSSFFDCKAKVKILDGTKINPTLYDLTYTPEVNNGINSPPSKEELDTLQLLKGPLFQKIKELYQENIKFKSYILDGINFSRANVEYNPEYLILNFSF